MAKTLLYKGYAFFHSELINNFELTLNKHSKSGEAEIVCSLDLNLTLQNYKIQKAPEGYILKNKYGINIGGGETVEEITINHKLVELLQNEDNKIFAVDFKNLEARPVHFASEFGNVKLVFTEDAPTMEIDGVKMHRSQGISPWQDSACKVKDIVKRGMNVLDTCTGLGYTAIISVRQGAKSVYSFERNPAVLKTAALNPWSAEFFTAPEIKSNSGSVFDAIKSFGDGQFDAIVHDPPRFSHAGELYSEEFYDNAFRVLQFNGKMFHYIGDPDSAFGKKHFGGINKRLRDAGFDTTISKKNYGIICEKRGFK